MDIKDAIKKAKEMAPRGATVIAGCEAVTTTDHRAKPDVYGVNLEYNLYTGAGPGGQSVFIEGESWSMVLAEFDRALNPDRMGDPDSTDTAEG